MHSNMSRSPYITPEIRRQRRKRRIRRYLGLEKHVALSLGIIPLHYEIGAVFAQAGIPANYYLLLLAITWLFFNLFYSQNKRKHHLKNHKSNLR